MSSHQRSRPSKNPNTTSDRLTFKSSHKHRYSFKKSRSRSRDRDSPRSQDPDSPLLFKSKSEESALHSPRSIHKAHAEYNFSPFSGNKTLCSDSDLFFDPVLLKSDSLHAQSPPLFSKSAFSNIKSSEYSHIAQPDSNKISDFMPNSSKSKPFEPASINFQMHSDKLKPLPQPTQSYPMVPSSLPAGKQAHLSTCNDEIIKWDMHYPPQARNESDSDEDNYNPARSSYRDEQAEFEHIGKISSISPPQNGPVDMPYEKLNLVLDIDETMVNTLICDSQSDIIQARKMFGDKINEINIDGTTFLILLRPFAKEFVERISRFYNIFIYSHAAFEYIIRTIDLLDPESLYIRRDIIFKKDPTQGGSGYKKLSLIDLPGEEVHKTLILDDQRQIWSTEEQNKVIPSRKFIPFKSFRKDTSTKYYMFQNQDNRWIVQPDFKTDFQQYAESHLEESQLEDLLVFFEEIARIWDHSAGHYNSVDEVYNEVLSNIMKGCRANVVSDAGVRQFVFEETARKMGAQMVGLTEAEMVFVDEELDEEVLESVKEMIPEEKEIEAFSANWITEAFFTMRRPGDEIFKRNFDLL